MIWPSRKQTGNASAPRAAEPPAPAPAPVAAPVAAPAPAEAKAMTAAVTAAATAAATPPVGKDSARAEALKLEAKTDLKVELHQKLLDRINLSALDSMSREQVGREIGDIVQEMLKELNHALNLAERRQLVEDILDELLGLGPLEPLLKDPSISEIMVNTAFIVFVERKGRIEETKAKFADNKHLLRIIQKIVSGMGRRIDESSPMVDARLPDGSRVNAIIPPLAVDGPILTIRKFAKVPIDMDKLVGLGAMPDACADVLRAVVAGRRNVLISGGTGSGKTTMLNAMSASIGAHERIVTIEDSAELQLQQRHVIRLETRPANIEGRGEINQRDLVKNSLRMRPDRIVLGECRGGEAFDMLQAMNTGHDGSMTTIHANTPRDALSRLEQMIGMSGIDISPKSARAQIASAIHVVIQLERLSDGKRRLTSVAEVTGMEGETVLLQEIFRFDRQGIDEQGNVNAELKPTGIRPKFTEYLSARGIKLAPHLFDPYRRLDSRLETAA
ncbi:CpaF family protein [Sandaracinobacteroides sp. A072]|uniref:CpaF family protein n=1 Tax=Sandaracinobacteroides sp. A072 TaxID=3461146 RepID=UPI004042561E